MDKLENYMKYIIGAILIGSLILFLIFLVFNAVGFLPPQNVLQFGWIVWVALITLSYPIAKKIMA